MTVTRSAFARSGIGALVVAAATALAWWAWLGRDTTYQIDPGTGVASGPYEPWQVAGCALSLALVALVGGWAVGPWWTVPAMTITFTAAWSLRAAGSDESGLWLVGAVLVLGGMALGSALVSLVGWFLGGRVSGGRVSGGWVTGGRSAGHRRPG
ncbi:MAG TPA: hypothetical protein VES42_17420 [Pilimelia sp.]|nr:hypothetical protein [Pilimelia sp.]